MANARYHKRKPGRPKKDPDPPNGLTVEELIGAMWILHERYYKPLDKMMSLSLNADGTGEIAIDGVTLFRFKDLENLFSFLRI